MKKPKNYLLPFFDSIGKGRAERALAVQTQSGSSYESKEFQSLSKFRPPEPQQTL